ncbi:MAG: flagellar biosynthetic protein FliQ [Phycisphaerae bacterium]|nr:flagellar biosynthetic protein FliQ [Phycisphaerae bacterium]
MNYDQAAIDLVRQTLIIAIKIAAPILGMGVLIGLIISILQSATQIQDQTVSFVPKIVAMLLAAALLVPWIVQECIEFASLMFRLM